MVWDRTKFIILLCEAVGDESAYEFCKRVGIDNKYLAKVIGERIKRPPSQEILRKIATASNNRIRIEDLMQACGYVQSDYSIYMQSLHIWMKDVDNLEFIEFIYKSYKKGVTKEMLRNAKICFILD